MAHEILETAQSPNSSFPFLFDIGLELGLGIETWDLGNLYLGMDCWTNVTITFLFSRGMKRILNFTLKR